MIVITNTLQYLIQFIGTLH